MTSILSSANEQFCSLRGMQEYDGFKTNFKFSIKWNISPFTTFVGILGCWIHIDIQTCISVYRICHYNVKKGKEITAYIGDLTINGKSVERKEKGKKESRGVHPCYYTSTSRWSTDRSFTRHSSVLPPSAR